MEKVQCKDCKKTFDSARALEQHTTAKHSQQSETYKSAQVVKRKFSTKSLAVYAIVVFVAGIVIYGLIWAFTTPNQIGPIGGTHIHADFAVFLDGKQITPFGPQYFVRARHVHVESGPGEGTIIHMHATGVSLGNFFNTLSMKFDKDCFVTDSKVSYCNSADKTLKMFVKHAVGNWTQNSDYDKYVFTDLDKILITYGNETPDQLQLQMNAVTDFAKENSGRVMPA